MSTADFSEFAAIREDILLRIIDVVRENGSDLAFNSSTIYLAKDSGLDKGKASGAEQLAEQWRKSKTMPFPDYTPEEISQFEDRKFPYPPPESGRGLSPRFQNWSSTTAWIVGGKLARIAHACAVSEK